MSSCSVLLFLIGFSAINALENLTDIKQNEDDSLVKTIDAQYPANCAEALPTWGTSGIYKIQIPNSDIQPFYVYCELDPQGGPSWTIFQRRINGLIDFYRMWQEYVAGFGNLDGEYFIGLDKLHGMTDSAVQELWIQMEDFENQKRFAKYSTFAITDETQNFTMNMLGSYSGDAGDSLKEHAGQKFTTKDRKNDSKGGANCAQTYRGAWWYKACHTSNLNGKYLRGEYSEDKYGQGINWHKWHGFYYSLKYVHMAIRPTFK